MTRCTEVRASVGVALTAAWLAFAVDARAQAEDRQAARPLFDEGRELMKQGDFARACPKLEQAVKLFAGAGILLNLGDCHEHAGRLALAWSDFDAAAARATRDGRPEEAGEAARRRLTLEPRLAHLKVNVEEPSSGVTVFLGGTALDASKWGAPVPVDPGKVVVTARAPGGPPWTKTVTLDGPGDTASVRVPQLAPQAAAEPTAAATPDVDAAKTAAPAPSSTAEASTPAADGGHPMSTARLVALGLGGAGVIGIGVGTAFGLIAASAWSDAKTACGGSTAACTNVASGNSDRTTALNDSTVSTVSFVVGGALVAGAALLWFTAAPTDGNSGGVALTPGVGPGGADLSLSGRF